MSGKLRPQTEPCWIISGNKRAYKLDTLTKEVVPNLVNGFSLKLCFGKLPPNSVNMDPTPAQEEFGTNTTVWKTAEKYCIK